MPLSLSVNNGVGTPLPAKIAVPEIAIRTTSPMPTFQISRRPADGRILLSLLSMVPPPGVNKLQKFSYWGIVLPQPMRRSYARGHREVLKSVLKISQNVL